MKASGDTQQMVGTVLGHLSFCLFVGVLLKGIESRYYSAKIKIIYKKQTYGSCLPASFPWRKPCALDTYSLDGAIHHRVLAPSPSAGLRGGPEAA